MPSWNACTRKSNESSADFEEGISFEDCKAQEIMDRSVTLVNGHYQLKLPFHQETPDLPDILPKAERILTWLKGKMQREPISRSKYTFVVETYRAEGASKQVPDDELVNLKPFWYLPHFAVWHPKKSEEPRVVFDCASRSGETSLNQQDQKIPVP